MNTIKGNENDNNTGAHFLIFSENESAMNQEPMFWSNKDGWGDFGSATVFSERERADLELPASAGNDAQWLPLEEAQHKELDIEAAADHMPVVSFTLSLLQVTALRLCIAEFIRAESEKGGRGLGRDYIHLLRPVRRALLAGHKTVNLSLLEFALIHEALQRKTEHLANDVLRADVYERSIAVLRWRFTARASVLRHRTWMNEYSHDFQCRCPVNDEIIHYRIVIESNSMIPVEAIVAVAAANAVAYHESLAEEFFKAFGGSQRLSAYHHGVHIKTIRNGTNEV